MTEISTRGASACAARDKNGKRQSRPYLFWILNIWILILFRISDFDIRIYKSVDAFLQHLKLPKSRIELPIHCTSVVSQKFCVRFWQFIMFPNPRDYLQKFEYRNTKSETNPKFRNSNDQNFIDSSVIWPQKYSLILRFNLAFWNITVFHTFFTGIEIRN